MTVTRYPLSWPEHFPRAKARHASKFKTTLPAALRNVQRSLQLFATDSGRKVEGIIISSNVTLGFEKPDDPGVAVWFAWDGLQVCIPVDRYQTVADNLQAIHHIIEARRTELRHGTLALVRATFSGFTALPPPAGSKPPRSWREVLNLQHGNPAASTIDAAYRQLAKERHPDVPGGSHEAMAELNAAREAALREIGS